MPLINCEVSLILNCMESMLAITKLAITSMERRVITNTRRDTSPTNAIFQITDTKLYVPVVTLSTKNKKRLSEQLRA